MYLMLQFLDEALLGTYLLLEALAFLIRLQNVFMINLELLVPSFNLVTQFLDLLLSLSELVFVAVDLG